jgi:hypothetical protein
MTAVITGVTLHDRRKGMQAFARIPGGGWIFTQVSQTGRAGHTAAWHAARGDLTLSHVTGDGGRVVGWMYLRGFGHGQSVSVQPATDGLWVWVEAVSVRGPGANPNGYGTQVARFRWRPGATITPWTAGVELYDPVPGAVHVSPSLSLADELAAVRYMTADSKIHVAVYPLAAFLARDYTPAAVIDEPPPGGTVQGWALLPGGQQVALLTGTATTAANPPPGDTRILTYGADGLISAEPVTAAPGLPWREPEGIQPAPGGAVLSGFASRRRLGRVANIYRSAVGGLGLRRPQLTVPGGSLVSRQAGALAGGDAVQPPRAGRLDRGPAPVVHLGPVYDGAHNGLRGVPGQRGTPRVGEVPAPHPQP